MDLIKAHDRAFRALAAARAPEAREIADALSRSGIVGVVGEAEVGKSTIVHQALDLRPNSTPHLRLDLGGVADEAHVAWLLARAVVVAYPGQSDASLLAAEHLQPAEVRQRRLALTRLVGPDLVEEAQHRWPTGALSLEAAVEGVERLAHEAGATTLWIDHIEAPGLTPRHPVDVERLLWAFRELSQRQLLAAIVVSGRAPAARLANGPRAAFHKSGRWMTLAEPSPDMWIAVGGDLGVEADAAAEMATLTGGHPRTTLMAMSALARSEQRTDPQRIMHDLVVNDDGLAARAVQHARTLHRLGGQVLSQVALGLPPYGAEQRGATSRTEITRVLNRLRLAGLLASRGRGRWEVVNPLLDMRLRQGVPRTSRRIG